MPSFETLTRTTSPTGRSEPFPSTRRTLNSCRKRLAWCLWRPSRSACGSSPWKNTGSFTGNHGDKSIEDGTEDLKNRTFPISIFNSIPFINSLKRRNEYSFFFFSFSKRILFLIFKNKYSHLKNFPNVT